jgi:membrane associated rhomboid family serine protease
MFPLGDDNPRLRLPIAMFALLGLNVLAWVLVQGLGTDPALAGSICRFGLITGDVLDTVPAGASFRLTPDLVCVIEGGHNWRTVFTSMFMHGGWFHIVGNMWFLWVFGDNVEDVMGPVRFVVFYLLCGVAAAVAQMLADTQSLVPMVGASGAIGGVMGAYALLFPRARVRTLVFLGFYVTIFWVPAILMLGYWFLIQLLGGLPTLGQGQRGGVAFLAHIGGFLAGLALAPVFARNDYLRQQRALPRLGNL